MSRSRELITGVAGAVAVGTSQVTLAILDGRIGLVAQLLILIAVSLATYLASYSLCDGLYERWFWPRFTRRNLNGDWKMDLTNLVDGSTRTGTVHVVHTPQSIKLTCINYRDGATTPYSTWSSTVAAFPSDDTLLFVYEVDSTVDWKPFKRGLVRVIMSPDKPEVLTGHFFDSAPSDDRGPITFQRTP